MCILHARDVTRESVFVLAPYAINQFVSAVRYAIHIHAYATRMCAATAAVLIATVRAGIAVDHQAAMAAMAVVAVRVVYQRVLLSTARLLLKMQPKMLSGL